MKEELITIKRFSHETHNRNCGSGDPYAMTHQVTLKGTAGDRTFHVVVDDSSEPLGPIGTIEAALRKALTESGHAESDIPKLDEFSIPTSFTRNRGAAAEVEVVMLFLHSTEPREFRKKGQDVESLALYIMVEACNTMME